MTPIPFIGPSYVARSANYSVQRCVNLYLEGGKGKAPGLLIGTPGLTAPWLTTAANLPIRGMYVINSTTSIIVSGGVVYKVTDAIAVTTIGNIPDDNRPVTIAYNGERVFIASAGSLYSVTVGGASATFVLAGVGTVDTIGNFFIANRTTDNTFIWFAGADGNVFNPSNTKETNSKEDALLSVRVSRRTAYFFGSKSIEPWYTTGDTVIPFARIEGGVYEVGCIAKDSIAEMDAIFWLGGDEKGAGSVWTASGGAPQRISTPAIEYAIAQWPDMTDAYAFAYAQENHSFYVLSSVSGNETWVYDISTGEWHSRAWLHTSGALHRIRPFCHMYFDGKHLVGDWQTGAIYEYDLDTFSDNGNPLPAIRSCVALESGLENQRTVSFMLDMDSGVGLSTGQGSDPQAMLKWSKDGGKTWSNELWRSFGAIGEYAKRCVWRRVGGGRRTVFEVRITDPVKRQITGAYIA